MDLGPRELIIIAVVILVLFGSRQIPVVAKNIVEALRTVRDAFKNDASPAITKR